MDGSRGQLGYTTLELMATLAIVALLVMIAGTAFAGKLLGAQTDTDAASVEGMEKAGELAHLNGLTFSEGVRYTVPALVDGGYLKLPEANAFHSDWNTVVKQPDGTFTYHGNATPDPAADFVWEPVEAGTEVRIVDLAEHVTDTDVHIPAEIDGKPVTELGEASLADEGLTVVIIPESVETIGAGACEGNELESIDIPDSVTEIGDGAFADNKIKKAKLPKGLTKVEAEVLASNGLVTVNIPEHVTEIASHAFRNNDLNTVTVPNPVAVIDAEAFDAEVDVKRGNGKN